MVARLETNSNYMQLDLIFLSCATITGPPALNRLIIDHTTLADDLLDAGHSVWTIRSLILKVGSKSALSKLGSVRKQLLDMPLPPGSDVAKIFSNLAIRTE